MRQFIGEFLFVIVSVMAVTSFYLQTKEIEALETRVEFLQNQCSESVDAE